MKWLHFAAPLCLALLSGCATSDNVEPTESGSGGGGGSGGQPSSGSSIGGSSIGGEGATGGSSTDTTSSETVASSSSGGVECNAHADCADYPLFVCVSQQCVAATCSDGIQDGAELGVDCGGGTCAGCADGLPCAQQVDCQSGACVSSVCAPCGGIAQPCCPGGTCDALPITCAENTFTQWGGTSQECNCGLLRPGQKLLVDQGRWSCDGRFYLVMQSDGNLVLYYSGVGALWSSNTTGTGASYAVMQGDGNFVVYDSVGQAWWASGTSGANDWFVGIQNDGNLVVYDGVGQAWWDSNTCCY